MKMSKKTTRRLLWVGVSYSMWLALSPTGALADSCQSILDACTQDLQDNLNGNGNGCSRWNETGPDTCNEYLSTPPWDPVDACKAGCNGSSEFFCSDGYVCEPDSSKKHIDKDRNKDRGLPSSK